MKTKADTNYLQVNLSGKVLSAKRMSTNDWYIILEIQGSWSQLQKCAIAYGLSEYAANDLGKDGMSFVATLPNSFSLDQLKRELIKRSNQIQKQIKNLVHHEEV